MSSTLAASMALRCFLSGLRQQLAEGQHLAEHVSGLGERQRRRRHQRAVRRGQYLVTPWPNSCASVITSRGLPW